MHLTRIALLCDQCSNCPEVLVDHEATPQRRIVITDDFGGGVAMSEEQFHVLIAQARSGRLEEALTGLSVRLEPGRGPHGAPARPCGPRRRPFSG